jgi:hypothetical protein
MSKGERYGIIHRALVALFDRWRATHEPPPSAGEVLEGQALGVITAGSFDNSCRFNAWLKACVCSPAITKICSSDCLPSLQAIPRACDRAPLLPRPVARSCAHRKLPA